MNLAEMKNMILFQTNNDADDLGDFQPYINDYINEGYDKAAMAYAGQHVSVDSDVYNPLKNDKASPDLPDWLHRAIADWATWLIYRNGNAAKQQRGYAFRNSAEGLFAVARGGLETVKPSTGRYIVNIPR